MAYDKVVDSSVLDAGLKAIADAIREKGGTSDPLAFPTAMAEAIAAIQAGGGAKIELIELVPASDIMKDSPLTISHTLGVVPDFVLVQAKDLPNASTNGICINSLFLNPRFEAGGYNTVYYAYAYRASSYKAAVNNNTSNDSPLNTFLDGAPVPVSDMTETTITLCGIGNNYLVKLISGSSYFLIVGALVDE